METHRLVPQEEVRLGAGQGFEALPPLLSLNWLSP